MPTVPNFSIPDVAPDAKMASLDPTVGTAGMQAVAGLGDTISKGEDQINQGLMQLQHQNNENKALSINNDTQSQLNNLLYGQNGFYSKGGADAVAAYPQVKQQMQAIQQSALAQASNPDMQSMLSQSMDYMFNREMNSVGQHYAQESKQDTKDTAMATAENTSNTAALNWNNSSFTTSAFHTNQDVAQRIGAADGYSPEQVQDLNLTLNTKTAAGILDAAMAKSPPQALALYNQFSKAGYMDAATSLEVGTRLRRASMPGAIADISNGVLSSFNAQNTTGGGIPSGVQPPVNNPGNLRIPGSKDFQQFPTEQAGLDAMSNQLTLDNKPTAQGGHGLTTIAAIIGDPTHGWAPASDGNQTGSYITQVAAAAGVDPNAPIDLSDPKVRSKVMSAMIQREGDVRGNVPTPDDLMANLPALQQQASDRAQAQFPDQPDAGDQASQRVAADVVKVKNSYDTQQTGMLQTVMNFVDQNKTTDPSDLLQAGGPTSAAYLGLSPQGQKSVQAALQQNIPGFDTKPSPAGDQMYYKLLGLSYSDPSTFRSINLADSTITSVVPRDRLYTLMSAQKAIANKAPLDVSHTDMSSIMSNVAPLLISADVGTKGGQINPKDPNYQQIAGALGEQVKAYVAKNGALPSTLDQQKMASALLVQGTIAGTGGIFFEPTSERLYQARNDDQVDPASNVTYGAEGKGGFDPRFQPTIPAKDLADLNASYQKVYGHPPDMATAQALYMRRMGVGS